MIADVLASAGKDFTMRLRRRATEVRLDCSQPPRGQVAEVRELGERELARELARQGAAEAAAERQQQRRHTRAEALAHLQHRARWSSVTEPLTTEDLRGLLIVLDLDGTP